MESYYFESSVSRWTEPQPPCTMIALHDVDLLPIADDLKYEHVGRHPYHLIPFWMHPLYYAYSRYIGGVIIISRESYRQINGFSNRFWGWGKEDDEFGLRLRAANLAVSGIFAELVNSEIIQQNILRLKRKANLWRSFQSLSIFTRRRTSVKGRRTAGRYVNLSDFRDIQVPTFRDYASGLNTTRYTVLSRIKTEVSNVLAWIINVQLHCDVLVTPYCQQDS